MYILLSKLTPEGRRTIKGKPERIKEVNSEIEAFGAHVIEQFATLGDYDFVNLVEAPNNAAIAQVSIELGSRGTVEIKSMPTMTIVEFISMIKSSSIQKDSNDFLNANDHVNEQSAFRNYQLLQMRPFALRLLLMAPLLSHFKSNKKNN